MTMLLDRVKSKTARLSPIGLDVAPSGLRAVQLERRGDHWKVLRATSWHRRDSEVGTSLVEGFSTRVKESLSQRGFRGRPTVAGLSNPELELHALEIPVHGAMESAERFGEAVALELDRVTSFADGRTVSSHWHLPSSKMTKTTAIGVAAPKSEVDAVMSMVHSVGLDCERIDATPCALSRLGVAVRPRAGSKSDEIWSVLDIGRRLLRLIVCVGDVPVLVRILGSGCDSWTQGVAEALGLSIEAAEIHKRDHGIDRQLTAQGDKGGSGSAEIAAMIFNVLRVELDLAVAEIERSYEYVMRCYPERQASGVLLVGGGADLRGLRAHLSEKLGVDVSTLDTIASKAGSSFTVAPAVRESLSPYACAIGLAIGAETGR
jgi:type IV pilus assembly protein PilM